MKSVVMRCAVLFSVLLSLALFSACGNTSQTQAQVKQKFDELSNDLKMTKSNIADLELEIEVLTEQMGQLANQKRTQAAADPKLIGDLTDRIKTLEEQNANQEKVIQNFEKKISETMKASQKPINVPAVLTTEAKTETPAQESKKPADIAQKSESPSAAPTAQRSAPREKSGFYYVVKPGESLQQIATANAVPENRIRQANRIPSGLNPLSNQRIFIPQ